MTKDGNSWETAAPRPSRVIRYNHDHGQHGWCSSSAWNELGDLAYGAINRTFERDLGAGKVWIGREARRHSDKWHPGDYARAKPDIAAVLSSPLFLGLPQWRGSKKAGTHVAALYGPLSDGSDDWLVIPVEMTKDAAGRYRAESLYIRSQSRLQEAIKAGTVVPAKGK